MIHSRLVFHGSYVGNMEYGRCPGIIIILAPPLRIITHITNLRTRRDALIYLIKEVKKKVAKYPNLFYDPRIKENLPGVIYDPSKKTLVFAEDFVKVDEEVVAIQHELGTNPRSGFNTVRECLEHILHILQNHETRITTLEPK